PSAESDARAMAAITPPGSAAAEPTHSPPSAPAPTPSAAMASAAPPPAAAEPALPAAPPLILLRMLTPPPSFCSEVDRGQYLAKVFNPTVDASNDNVAKANAHLDDLTRASAAAPTIESSDAAHQAFAAYRPIADAAYQFGLRVLALRPAIMAAP